MVLGETIAWVVYALIAVVATIWHGKLTVATVGGITNTQTDSGIMTEDKSISPFWGFLECVNDYAPLMAAIAVIGATLVAGWQFINNKRLTSAKLVTNTLIAFVTDKEMLQLFNDIKHKRLEIQAGEKEVDTLDKLLSHFAIVVFARNRGIVSDKDMGIILYDLLKIMHDEGVREYVKKHLEEANIFHPKIEEHPYWVLRDFADKHPPNYNGIHSPESAPPRARCVMLLRHPRRKNAAIPCRMEFRWLMGIMVCVKEKFTMEGGKATIAFAVLAVLFLIAPSADAEDNATAAQFAGESVPAPFGLRWGMTCAEIIALGAKDIGQGAPCEDAVNLPEELKGFQPSLKFDDRGGLFFVAASRVLRDSDVARRMVRDIRAQFDAKHGKGNVAYDLSRDKMFYWEFEDGSVINIIGLFRQKADTHTILLEYKTKAALSYEESPRARAPSKVEKKVPAPFGLRWGMTCPEIIALGAIDIGETPCGVVLNLPNGIKGFEFRLGFNDDEALIDVDASKSWTGKRVNTLPLFKEILATLKAKYGLMDEKYKMGNYKTGAPFVFDYHWKFEDGGIFLTQVSEYIATLKLFKETIMLKYKTKSYTGKRVPAPFGLRWGMTCPEIIALGAKNIGETPCEIVANLPKGLKGFDVSLQFDDSGELIALTADNFRKKGRNAGSSRRKVEALRAALVAKYGKEEYVAYDSSDSVWLWWEFEDGSVIELKCSFVTDVTDPASAVVLVYSTKDHEAYQKKKDKIEAEL